MLMCPCTFRAAGAEWEKIESTRRKITVNSTGGCRIIILTIETFVKPSKRENMQSDQNTVEFPAPPSETRPFSVERLHCPLSLRLKPKGNDIPIGNIHNGTQALHLLASRPQHTPFSWTLGWRDQGVDWFYPASERYKHQIPQRPS